MTYLRVAVIATVTALATVLMGWWSVAAVGLVSGFLSAPGRAAVLQVGGGAALGWAVILAGAIVSGPVWVLAQRVGPVFGVPGWGFLAMAIVFPALLAGSAALLAGELGRLAAASETMRRTS